MRFPCDNMKLYHTGPAKRPAAQTAFSLIELVVAVSIILVVFVTIFGGMTMGLTITQLSRENLRATQIMLDKMEGVRLYRWDQLTNSNVLIPSFSNWFFETNNIGSTNATGNGVQYTGVVSVAAIPLTTSYTNYMRAVTVTIGWTSGNGNLSHTRSMTTFVSQQGMQNYIYND
jgi:type II secretory pathway pseudopilin PulG